MVLRIDFYDDHSARFIVKKETGEFKSFSLHEIPTAPRKYFKYFREEDVISGAETEEQAAREIYGNSIKSTSPIGFSFEELVSFCGAKVLEFETVERR